MVAAVRRGRSMREVARDHGISLSTLQRWVTRAADRRLDRVDFNDRPAGPRTPANRVSRKVEDRVLSLRRQLREESDLGEFGATAIRRELARRRTANIPSLRTIGRILERRGALDYRHRLRHDPPPKGWYLPGVADSSAEVDEFDLVEGLVIEGGTEVEVINVVSLHGGLVGSWPRSAHNAQSVREALLEHWRKFGLPDYAQFDNDTRFQGPHQHPGAIGTVIRACLSLEVVPVFAVPRETGFQAAIENYNGQWLAKVWARFHHRSLPALKAQSAKYVAASRSRSAARIEAAPERRPFPPQWKFDPKLPCRGRILFLRRTSAQGQVNLLGRTFAVDTQWAHRLVRCELDIEGEVVRFYALRRRDPNWQPLLRQEAYGLPSRYFKE
jgi:transposase-like protein